MNQRAYMGLVALLLVGSGCGSAQKAEPYRVGIVSGVPMMSAIIEPFKARMTELGYVEGQRVIYVEETGYEGPADEARAIDAVLEQNLDLLVTLPTEVSQMARERALEAGVPLVFSFAFVEGMNLIAHVRAPGEGITGVRYPGSELAIKRLETLREIQPDVSRVMIPYLRGYPIVEPQMVEMRAYAMRMGVDLIEAAVDSFPQLPGVLEALRNIEEPAEAVLFIADPIALNPESLLQVEAFAVACNIPIAGALTGASPSTLFAVTLDLTGYGRLTADQVDRVLRGASPGSLPVLSGDPILAVDLPAAARLGITIPEPVIARADMVVR